MNRKGFSLAELMVVALSAFFIFVIVIGGTWWTGRSLDWALTQWKHHSIHIPYWLDFIIACIGNGFVLIFDLIIEILRRIQ